MLCDVPCERHVDPRHAYAFRTEGGFLRPDYFEDVPDLRPHVGAGEVEVRPTPRKTGRLAGGIVMTSLGGIAMATGAVLLGVNCGKSTSRCVAGGVTGGDRGADRRRRHRVHRHEPLDDRGRAG